MELPNESYERTFDKVLDADYVLMLGSLGLYDASMDEYVNPPEPMNVFKVAE